MYNGINPNWEAGHKECGHDAKGLNSNPPDDVPLCINIKNMIRDGVYEVNVSMMSQEVVDNIDLNNYFVAKTVDECMADKCPLTITAASDTKNYDGNELVANKYTVNFEDDVTYNGDSITSVTVTGSQTNVGESNNVPSKAVIKSNNGTDVTKYYDITYKNGTLKVEDTSAPTCTLSVSSEGVISYDVSDNFGLKSNLLTSPKGDKLIDDTETCYFNEEDVNWVNSSSVADGTIEGKYTLTSQDCFSNKKTCSITVDKVTQMRTRSCKTYTYGSTCTSWGAWGAYGSCSYYSDMGANDDSISCRGCGNGSKYECRSRSCNSYNITGCSAWNDYGEWSDVETCTSGEATDHKKYTDCQTIYKSK